MSKIYYTLLLFLFFVQSNAQEENGKTSKNPFNKWSVEVFAGQNKAVRPFTDGYFSSNPSNFFSFSGVNYFEIAVRKMLTDRFGMKLGISYNEFKNLKNSGSLPFNSKSYLVSIQAVANLGRVLQFESFTSKIGLLAHAGIQASKFTSNTKTSNVSNSEMNGGLIVGVTPVFKLSDCLAINADFTTVSNIRQHLNWDGAATSESSNLAGLLYETSIGITYYLGKNKVHADWYIDDRSFSSEYIDSQARKRLDSIESMLSDFDRDGVPDYLDLDDHTPENTVVDNQGRAVVNQSIEKTQVVSEKTAEVNSECLDLVSINVFFDVNRDRPNKASINSLHKACEYLKRNPGQKIKLIGYADTRGKESKNKFLSYRRARNVMYFFLQFGILPDRIEMANYGVDKHYSKNELGYDIARRVEIVFLK